MKIDSMKHIPSWRGQRGNRVEWFLGSRKGTGTILRPNKLKGGWDPEEFVVQCDDGEIRTINSTKIRILKSKKKQLREERARMFEF